MTTVTIIQKTVRQKGEFTLHLSSHEKTECSGV